MITITLTETRLSKNPNTKTTYIVDNKETKEVTQEQYDLTTNDYTCKWFRRLGGSETKQMGSTFLGYVCTKLTSVSPDRQTKIVREYSFKK
jgi:DNA gyrase/topoisomerase IV subunit B